MEEKKSVLNSQCCLLSRAGAKRPGGCRDRVKVLLMLEVGGTRVGMPEGLPMREIFLERAQMAKVDLQIT